MTNQGTVIKVENFKANRLFWTLRSTETGRGQKADLKKKILRPIETGRGPEGKISHKFYSLGLLL
jgi:hypothetical protein